MINKKSKERNNVIAVIPAYNESKYIGEVVRKTKKHVDKVIVVDDASNDKTAELAKQAGALVIRHEINLQKGASLKTGCELALKFSPDIIITLDADGQHDPDEIPKLLEKLKQVDFVIGSRQFNKEMTLKSKAGNIILSKLSNLLFKTNIKDSQTGFRAFKAKIYDKIKWESSDYGVESEMIKNIHDNKISYKEVNVKTIYNDKYKGTTPIDGIKIAYTMLKMGLMPRK